jgi:hypothetical protein
VPRRGSSSRMVHLAAVRTEAAARLSRLDDDINVSASDDLMAVAAE